MTTSIEIRNDLRVEVAFTDEDGAAIDPESVFLELTPPEGTSPAQVVIEYGVDAITRTGVGLYNALVYVDVPGHWTYCWRGDGDARGAKSACFDAYEGCAEDQ